MRAPHVSMPTPRGRRGVLNALKADWRRMEPGTNHIACFGVWRRGARRHAERPNRTGLTRWHMPHRSGVRIARSDEASGTED